jgi:predicted ATPase
MLDDVRLTLLETALHQPLLLVLEDLHWADRSTQDLVSALARTAQGRLLLVLTVRSDELYLARVAKLSSQSRGLVRTASADGSRLDTELLTTVTEVGPTVLEKLLREAIDEHVLSQRGRIVASVTDYCARPCTTICSRANAPGSTQPSRRRYRIGSTKRARRHSHG